jgi:hypothetical protein
MFEATRVSRANWTTVTNLTLGMKHSKTLAALRDWAEAEGIELTD